MICRLLASIILFAPVMVAAQAGTLFLVGGGPQPAELVKEFVRLAGGPGRARIVVMAMASAEGATTGEEKAQQLRSYGATAINVFTDRRGADSDSVARLLDDATGIWFGGGLQTRLAGVIVGTRVEAAIHARYRAGAVVGGTSAGAAIISTPMITGDERRPGGDRPLTDTTAVGFMTIDRGNVVTAQGLGLLTTAIVDQHFLRRKRHNRLMSLVLEGPVHLGAGIDESTALIVHPQGSWEVQGASQVVVYDARAAERGTGKGALGGAGLAVHILPAGARFDPASRRVTMP